MGRLSARERWAKCRAGKHDHSCQIVHIAKAKSGANDEFDFVVDSLRVSVGESEAGGNNDGSEVVLNFLAQISKLGDSATLGSGHPLGKSIGNLVRLGFEGQTQILFE